MNLTIPLLEMHHLFNDIAFIKVSVVVLCLQCGNAVIHQLRKLLRASIELYHVTYVSCCREHKDVKDTYQSLSRRSFWAQTRHFETCYCIPVKTHCMPSLSLLSRESETEALQHSRHMASSQPMCLHRHCMIGHTFSLQHSVRTLRYRWLKISRSDLVLLPGRVLFDKLEV